MVTIVTMVTMVTLSYVSSYFNTHIAAQLMAVSIDISG